MKPIGSNAFGQKVRLRSELAMNDFDAVQMEDTFKLGMRIDNLDGLLVPDESDRPL